VAQGNGNDWLHQLEEAAVDGAEPAPASTSVAILPLSDGPSTRNPVSKEAASTWRTPRRTRKNAAAESSSTESTTDGAASPASGHPIPSPTLKGTPKKKLLKLNTNGKLLSSPVSINPVSKSKGRSGDEKHDKHPKTKRIILKYGSDPEGRSRIGMQIDEVLGKSNIFQNVRLSRNDAPTKMTHPFFLGKRAQKLQSGDHAGSSDTSSIDQVLGPNDKPTPLHATVAWKDIVFTSQKPTFTKTVDAIDAPWPPVGMQHLGTEAKEGRQSHPLKLRGATTSKSKEHRTQITTEEDIMQSK
jgi:sorting nexin-8